MAYYAGIDGGGTKTSCAIGDEQAVLGRGLAAGSKIARVGPGPARAAVRMALEQACERAHIEARQIERLCLGVAGAARTHIVEAMRALVQDLVSCPVEIVGDMAIALEAAFGEGAGVIVVAGTGSICFGRDQRGQTARAGGWGPAISDEGSGEWIGRRAVALALRAHDRGQHTALLPAILSAWKVGTRDEVSTLANRHPAPEFSQLFPVVTGVAQQGDSLACALLKEAGEELGELAQIVVQRLWPGGQRTRLRMTGGVFQHSQQVRDAFSRCVRAHCPQVEIGEEEVDPALGALALARRAAPARAAGGRA